MKKHLIHTPEEAILSLPHGRISEAAFEILWNMMFYNVEYTEFNINQHAKKPLIRAGLIGWYQDKYYEKIYKITDLGIIYLAEHEEWLNLKPDLEATRSRDSYDGKYFCREEYHFG